MTAGDPNDSQSKKIPVHRVSHIFDELGEDKIKRSLLVCIKQFDFFFTTQDQEYFDWEKLVVFFILYSNASKEHKCLILFDLISIDV
jgi:hypothetical protein